MATSNHGWLRRIKFRFALRFHIAVLFNVVGTYVPSHLVRQAWLRLCGARIGERVAIFRGTTVHEPKLLVIGDHCVIGFRCVLDARGGLSIGDNVNISSDVQLLTADHDANTADFASRVAPIAIEDRVWLATRVTVLKGVRVGEGAVAQAGSLVTRDVEPYEIVAGVPARAIAERTRNLTYTLDFRPRFF